MCDRKNPLMTKYGHTIIAILYNPKLPKLQIVSITTFLASAAPSQARGPADGLGAHRPDLIQPRVPGINDAGKRRSRSPYRSPLVDRATRRTSPNIARRQDPITLSEQFRTLTEIIGRHSPPRSQMGRGVNIAAQDRCVISPACDGAADHGRPRRVGACTRAGGDPDRPDPRRTHGAGGTRAGGTRAGGATGARRGEARAGGTRAGEGNGPESCGPESGGQFGA